jgi:predicted O-methyltransferase YrrM
LHNNILEIGIGMYGGTHILWRQIFRFVTTIELSHILTLKIKLTEHLDGRSKIVIGNSHRTKTFEQVKGEYDVLFIDGDHSYEGITLDYLTYSKLVRQGGIIALHDCICDIEGFGIKKFVEDLKVGNIDGKTHEINIIAHSKNVGIAYEVKNW